MRKSNKLAELATRMPTERSYQIIKEFSRRET